MKKLVLSAATATLLLSMGVDAEAAIKKVSSNVKIKGTKLVYKSNGKVVKGFVKFKKKVYKNGYIYTGLKDKTYYKRGVKGNGIYKKKMYQKGKIFTGVVKDTYYKKGVKASGTVAGKVYEKGALFSGVRRDVVYEAGVPLNGTKDNVFYQNGTVYTGTAAGVRYEDGERVEGLVDDVFYQKGKPLTGVIDQVLYMNGEKPLGYTVYEKKLYNDGELETDVVKVDQIWYAGGQVATGKIVSQDGQEIVVANGLEVAEEDQETVVNEEDDVSTGVDDELEEPVETDTEETPSQSQPAPTTPVGYEVINGKLYYNGKLYTPKYVYEQVLYDGGKRAVGVQKYQSLYYDNGTLATGDIAYNGKILKMKNGALVSGIEDGKYYQNGLPATGVVGGLLYENGNKSTGIALYKNKYYKDATLATGDVVYNGKTVTVQNGVPLNGVIDGKYYINGVLSTGIVNRIYYIDGIKATGREWYNGLFFIDGEQVDGIFEDNGKYYVNGKLATGLYDVKDLGVRYIVAGELANGLYGGIYYENGERLKGLALKDGKLLKDGIPNIGIVQYDDGYGAKWYYNAFVANGVLFTQLGEEIAVKDGVGITGSYNNVYYINGKLEQGLVLRNGELYKNGRPNNTLVEYEGIWYARTKPANGIQQVANKTILFENGLKYSGVYANRLYENGVLKQGEHIEGGILYINGIIETKVLYGGKLYVLGRLADSFTEYEGKLYQAGGTLSVDFQAHNGKLYKDGLLYTTPKVFEDILYIDGKVAEGLKNYGGQDYLNGVRVP